jgi:uncharacterized protein YbaR (Trm112 family)
MSAESRNSLQLNADALAMLACPVCHGVLRLEADGEKVTCASCGRGFPVIDGIPVLIPERAVLKRTLPS